MRTKLITMLICSAALSLAAHAEDNKVMIVNENFSAYIDGATPSDEWIMDYTAGADIKDGAISSKSGGTLTGAAYEIPDGVKKHIKDSDYTLNARIKADGDECGILYATDKAGKAILCTENDFITKGDNYQ